MAHSIHSGKSHTNGLQKFLLYLILVNFLLLYLYATHIGELPLFQGLWVTLLAISYNLMLCRLVNRRARRRGDGYIIYPVVISAILLCACIFYYFIIR